MNKNKDQFQKAALAATVFRSCTLCYREIRASSLVSAVDYRHEKSVNSFNAGRPSKQDFCADVEIACKHVTSKMNFDWNKFQLMYLLPMDLDEAQEFYVERIFGTHQPLATDSLDFDALKRQSNQVGRVLKNRNRRARLENACGLEFVRRWGGGPKAYFAYQRKGINERCSSESSILQEPLQEVDTDNIGGDLLPQSDNSKIQALIESAFKYAENHGEMPIESERGA